MSVLNSKTRFSAQDIHNAVAKIPTPKHVGPTLRILKETRSKSTVSLLNRFGNSINYKETQRYYVNGIGS